MDLQFDPHKLLYHGTIDLYGNVIAKHGIQVIARKKGSVDFGPGFYLSMDQEKQSALWALQRADLPMYHQEALDLVGITQRDFSAMSDQVKPVVLVFKIISIDIWQKLKHRLFLLSVHSADTIKLLSLVDMFEVR